MYRGLITRLPSSALATFTAVLVALSAKARLSAIVPAELSGGLGPDSQLVQFGALWIADSLVRLLSFAAGGVFAVLLVGFLTGRLLAMLIGAAVVATVFEQFPRSAAMP